MNQVLHAPYPVLMTNDNIRLFPHDRLMASTFLRIIPGFIRPNHLTILRFLLTPIVLYFLWKEDWPLVLAFFLIASFTDALDGSLARIRRQITLWGTIADPIADKFLIGTVVVVFVAREVNFLFAVLIVFIEGLIALSGYIRHRRKKYSSANEYGKLKMLFQVAGITILLLARLLDFQLAVPFAVGTLSIAIVFAIVSLLTYGI